ncbi:hypothetical protein [Namhaeicola litoreus]|uniref:Uncharacterized protein n=1 Tax=Namhaeicola litoreus TaxID=1052145 RepID=A0ABW3Y575_9FLAO
MSLLGPFLPVFDYLMHYEYISEVMCENKDKPILTCNGKCYLEKQINKATDLLDHQHNKTIPPKLDVSLFPVFVVIGSFYMFIDYISESQNLIIFYEQLSPLDHISRLFKPPKL